MALDIVIFGGIGDLSLRKLLPSLFYLCKDGNLEPQSHILCVSRKEKTCEEFLDLVNGKLKEYVKEDYDENTWQKFCNIISYKKVDLTIQEDWHGLRDHLNISDQEENRNIIYYLSVTPSLFTPICQQIKLNDLNPEYSRVVVEKPLGEDLNSAEEINEVLALSFKEKQIYRIDHYLGKEAVQNILHLRFSNHLMETVWSKDHIERIDITVAETVGVESRAAFLDRVGTLRDMVQNHLMQLLTYITMEAPASLDADDIRDEKLKVINALRPIDEKNVGKRTIKAQYVSGEVNGRIVPSYLEELEQSELETTGNGETFVALRLNVDNARWDGVPFYLRTGKRMTRRYAEIRMKFKPPSSNIYQMNDSNELIIEIQPDLTVSIHMLMKQLMGEVSQLNAHRNQMDLNTSDTNLARMPEAYERLILEVIKGNQTYFVRDDEILASWKWIDGIRLGWDTTGQAMQNYVAGSMGPELE